MRPDLPFARRARARQRGMTLVITLIMLVLLTMFAISAINLSSSTTKIVGNMQARKTTDAVAQRVVDQVVSEGLFGDMRAVPVVPSWTPAGMAIEVTQRHCKAFTPQLLDPQVGTATWEFDVCVRDSFTGAKSYIRQGVSVKTLNAGTPCPTSAFVATSCI
ncbi:MAG: pilus assembly PilX N-terminal domain-containing protein [Steroidobacteraceae bacterium]